MDTERLQRRLARAGVASRRGAEALIAAGRVTVDGHVAVLGQRVGPDARIEVDGAPLVPTGEHVTWMVHKPRGLLSTVRDDRGRPTVMGLVPPHPGLHPVGRLDLDSEGLLLLTSDGDLTFDLTHPSRGHRKRYRVWCAEGRVDAGACAALEAGVALDDGPARAVRARPRAGGAEIVLEEGRKRQVRRMLAAVGYRVERLLRTHVGPLALDGLEPGAARRLGPEELARVGYDPSGSREGNPTAPPAATKDDGPMAERFFRAGAGAVQIGRAEIEARVAELGRQISDDYAGEDLHLICVLNGAFIFMADLVRAIELPLTTDFLSVSSYGSRTESSGEVRLVKDLEQSLKNKHVLLVEDIVDTGLTMKYLLGYLEGRGPLSVRVAALLSKPSRREVEVPVHYLGFEIDDAFVYGYGLDVGHVYRNLPFVTSQEG